MTKDPIVKMIKTLSKWISELADNRELLKVYNTCTREYNVAIDADDSINANDLKLMICASVFQKYPYKMPKSLPKVGSVEYNNLRLALEAMLLSELTGTYYHSKIFQGIMDNTKILTPNQWKAIKFVKTLTDSDNLDMVKLPSGMIHSLSVNYSNNSFYTVTPKFAMFTADVLTPVIETKDNIYTFHPQAYSMSSLIDKANGKVLVLGDTVGYVPYMIAMRDYVTSITVVGCDKELMESFEDFVVPTLPKDAQTKINIEIEDMLDKLFSITDNDYDTILICEDIERDDYLAILYILDLLDLSTTKVYMHYEEMCLWELFINTLSGICSNDELPVFTYSDEDYNLADILYKNANSFSQLFKPSVFKEALCKDIYRIIKARKIYKQIPLIGRLI